MATTGAAAWAKYFQGRGDVNTLVKTDTDFKSEDRSTIARLKKGDSVTVLEADAYSAQIKATHNKKFGYISFNALAKPGIKNNALAPSLKPQAFGIRDDVNYTIKNYIDQLRESLEERTDLRPEIKVYLDELITITESGRETTSALSTLASKFSTKLPVADINKDFGEVIGPIAIFKKKILEQKGIKVSAVSDKIFVPSRPNEPLLDYAIIKNRKQLAISAKSGKTTNTVKPADIMMLLAKNKATETKWKRTIQYQVFEAITNGNTISGPIMAGAVLASKYKEFRGLDMKTAKTVSKNTSEKDVKTLFFDYLTHTEVPKVNILSVAYSVEKKIEQLSKTPALDFSKIFSDAIENEVIYVKFVLSSQGIPKYEVYVSDDFRTKKVSMRTKNGYTRSADKMGIQS